MKAPPPTAPALALEGGCLLPRAATPGAGAAPAAEASRAATAAVAMGHGAFVGHVASGR